MSVPSDWPDGWSAPEWEPEEPEIMPGYWEIVSLNRRSTWRCRIYPRDMTMHSQGDIPSVVVRNLLELAEKHPNGRVEE